MYLKLSSAKWRLLRLGLNVLMIVMYMLQKTTLAVHVNGTNGILNMQVIVIKSFYNHRLGIDCVLKHKCLIIRSFKN